MAERIFISYRRDDSRGYAGRLQSDRHLHRLDAIGCLADNGELTTPSQHAAQTIADNGVVIHDEHADHVCPVRVPNLVDRGHVNPSGTV